VSLACGSERSYALMSTETTKKIMVVDGGLDGMEAATVCAIRGHVVDLFEKKINLAAYLLRQQLWNSTKMIKD
jgi:2-enoate reductase